VARASLSWSRVEADTIGISASSISVTTPGPLLPLQERVTTTRSPTLNHPPGPVDDEVLVRPDPPRKKPGPMIRSGLFGERVTAPRFVGTATPHITSGDRHGDLMPSSADSCASRLDLNLQPFGW
jgi:hypothetical protein